MIVLARPVVPKWGYACALVYAKVLQRVHESFKCLNKESFSLMYNNYRYVYNYSAHNHSH